MAANRAEQKKGDDWWDCPAAVFFGLERAKIDNNFELAATYQRRLRELGVLVQYVAPSDRPAAVKPPPRSTPRPRTRTPEPEQGNRI